MIEWTWERLKCGTFSSHHKPFLLPIKVVKAAEIHWKHLQTEAAEEKEELFELRANLNFVVWLWIKWEAFQFCCEVLAPSHTEAHTHMKEQRYVPKLRQGLNETEIKLDQWDGASFYVYRSKTRWLSTNCFSSWRTSQSKGRKVKKCVYFLFLSRPEHKQSTDPTSAVTPSGQTQSQNKPIRLSLGINYKSTLNYRNTEWTICSRVHTPAAA